MLEAIIPSDATRAAFFAAADKPFFPQDIDCFFKIAAGLFQGLFCLHHADAGLFTQVLYRTCRYCCHV